MGARAAMRPRVLQQPKTRIPVESIYKRRHVAVVGGGISGLTTAYRLAQDQTIGVTLYEKSPRLGGWLQTEEVKIPPHPEGGDGGDGGHVLFEWGPRTLRATGGLPTVELLSDLGLKDRIVHTPKNSPAAANRYIFHRGNLVPVPILRNDERPLQNLFNFWKALRRPPFKGMLGALLKAPFKIHPVKKDESIGNILREMLGPKIVDDVISAVYHGIYAGDIYKLSAEALAPKLYRCSHSKRRFNLLGSLASFNLRSTAELMYEQTLSEAKSKEEREALEQLVQDTSMMTLKGGMQDIVSALKQKLEAAPNVIIRCNTPVREMHKTAQGIALKLADTSQVRYDFVVSTIPPGELVGQLTTGDRAELSRREIGKIHPAATVMVVNLYYHNPNLVPVRGFGYLIPRSTMLEGQNPECALGVIFGSEVSAGQDTAQGTKLTVMLGGHWWADKPEKVLPSEQDGIRMAQSVLRRHLDITDEPAVAKARLQRNAIPQYLPGHAAAMRALHHWLYMEYGGRVTVTGGWYTGVGINDCIRSAKQMAIETQGFRSGVTGLNSYFLPLSPKPGGSTWFVVPVPL